MIADIITIAIGLHELKADGLWNMISTYKLHIYTAIVGAHIYSGCLVVENNI